MAAPLGFKTFNTGDVLSAADTNGYLMQGIWVFANATARDAAVTSPQEGNSCYLKDTDVIQVYSGSSWVVKSGGSSPLTTKGDLYTYSTTDARLPVGANGTTLVADSSTATGLKWQAASSGAMTLITRNSFSASSGLDIDNIFSDTYENYLVTISAHSSSNADLYLRGRYSTTTETGSFYSYGWAGVDASGSAVAIASSLNDKLYFNVSSGAGADNPMLSSLTFFRSSGSKKLILSGSAYNYLQERGYGGGGTIKTSQTWTGLNLFPSTGTITGTITVYGLAK